MCHAAQTRACLPACPPCPPNSPLARLHTCRVCHLPGGLPSPAAAPLASCWPACVPACIVAAEADHSWFPLPTCTPSPPPTPTLSPSLCRPPAGTRVPPPPVPPLPCPPAWSLPGTRYQSLIVAIDSCVQRKPPASRISAEDHGVDRLAQLLLTHQVGMGVRVWGFASWGIG